ncbi:unnamed protein product [Macrosiphum euphorbiae]|uniref:HAT C-terminal dimerisation domain-containing protein n=3 Tax=Macrosiphum euphorbiae TaxID=13131 RepID=A0AAV0XVI2_9HEMI|nr:unnamed protein product [Macrosiphum euphorbiae]
MGKHNSVSTLMKEMFPGIMIVKCICHSLHLCCSQACKSLPRRCEDLARNIYNFFGQSSKRQSQFVEFQNFCSIKVHKILHPSQTRWLSLLEVVNRILEQWEALRLFFTDKWLSEKLLSTESIYKQLLDPFTKAYFMFLEFILPKFTYLNQYFQTEKVILPNLHEKMEFTFKEILMYYMNKKYVLQTPLGELNPEDHENILPGKQIYVGYKLSTYLSSRVITSRQDLLSEFKTKCTEFYMVSCSQIKKRYNFSDTVLPLIRMLTPSVAVSFNKREEYPSICNLASQLPRIICENQFQLIEDQWRQLPLVNISKDIIKDEDPDKFWTYLKHLESGQFSELASFCLSVMSLPHSNAQCERIFSKMNRIKTKSRNRLITSTVSATLMTSECIKEHGRGICVDFVPSKEMFDRMCSNNLYPKTDLIDTYDFILKD